MTQLIITTIDRPAKGLKAGDVVVVVNNKGTRGRKEIADNGFIHLELYDTGVEKGVKEYAVVEQIANPAYDPPPPEVDYLIRPEPYSYDIPSTLVVNARKHKIDVASMGVPIHPSLSKNPKMQAINAGRGIQKHLMKDEIIKVRQAIKEKN